MSEKRKWSYKDITGMRFGRLVAIKVDHVKQYKDDCVEYWLCQCDCGNEKIIMKPTLTRMVTLSCGCYAKEKLVKQGKSSHKLHNVWKNMIDRCENEKSNSYKNYGGRGIKVCEEWHDYICFYNWAMSNGYENGLTIDRENNDGNYCPENCRWATRKIQGNNTRANRLIEYNGETKTLAQWSEILGIDYRSLGFRLRHGWSVEKAFTTLENASAIFIEYNGERKSISEWSRVTGLSPITIREHYRQGLCAEKIFQKRSSKCGYTGVVYIKSKNKYRSLIMINREQKIIGYYDTAEEAHRAYCEAKNQAKGVAV